MFRVISSGSKSYIQKPKSIVEELSQRENAPKAIFLDVLNIKEL